LLVINIKDHDIAFTTPQETLNIYFWKSWTKNKTMNYGQIWMKMDFDFRESWTLWT
jgi:hypothetical protein